MQRLVSGMYTCHDPAFSFASPVWNSTDDFVADKTALRALPKGSAVIIFTPDSTHFPIAAEALNLGHHVLVTKPATQKLEDHLKLIELAEEKGLICFVEQYVFPKLEILLIPLIATKDSSEHRLVGTC